MSDRAQAVFLSYASQDADAAKCIADALREAGVEVWFDQSELRGGDSWDRKIREQIRTCALFVPIISENTDSRPEGYFRLEWKLAVDRSHLLADDHPFLFPIAIGGVTDATARVPDRFREVQWTRVRTDESPSEIATRVERLLSGNEEPRRARDEDRSSDRLDRRSRRREKRPAWLRYAWSVVGLVLVAFYGFRPVLQWFRHDAPPPPVGSGFQSGMPTTPARALIAKARHLFEEEDPSLRENLSLAEDLLERAEKLDEFDGEVWAAHAQLSGVMMHWGIDRSDERRSAMRRQSDRALQLAPDSFESQLAKGWFLSEKQSSAAEAISLLEKLVERAPDDGRPPLLMGSAVWRINRRDDAFRWFEKAAAFPRTATSARFALSRLHFYQGETAEGMKALDEMIAIRPLALGLAAKLRAQVLYEGDLDGAVNTLKQIPASLLLDERGAFNAYRVWLWRREPDKALEVLRDLTLDFIDDANFLGPKAVLRAAAEDLAGRSDIARGNWEFALRQVEERLATAPNDEALLYHRALCLTKLGRTAEAELALRKVQQAGDFWGFNRWPGGGIPGILIKLGRTTEALDMMESQIDPKGDRPSLEWTMSARPVFSLNPDFDPVRKDPRFKAILQRVKMASDEIAGNAQAREADDKSVAVLAFANLSDDKDNEYFSDGISEELLNVLAKIPGLKVTARTSSFYFKNRDVPVPDIAARLGVAYVVEGSVRRQGDRVRITAQLIKAADGFQVWSDTFTRDLKDIFAVQDEISGLIAQRLQLKLGVVAPPVTVNADALQLYLEARGLQNAVDFDSFKHMEHLLQRVLTLEPQFAPAEGGLAFVSVTRALASAQAVRYIPDVIKEAEMHAERALERDPTSAEALEALGTVAWLQGRLAEGETTLRRAVGSNPNYSRGWQRLAWLLEREGKLDEALECYMRAYELDPLAVPMLDGLGRIRNQMGQPAETISLCEAVRGQPVVPPPLLVNLGTAQLLAGRTEAALATARKVLAVQPGTFLDPHAIVSFQGMAAWILAEGGAPEEAEAEIQAILAGPEPMHWVAGLPLLSLGRVDEACQLLRETPQHLLVVLWLVTARQPVLAKDPRFLRLLDELDAADAFRLVNARSERPRVRKESAE